MQIWVNLYVLDKEFGFQINLFNEWKLNSKLKFESQKVKLICFEMKIENWVMSAQLTAHSWAKWEEHARNLFKQTSLDHSYVIWSVLMVSLIDKFWKWSLWNHRKRRNLVKNILKSHQVVLFLAGFKHFEQLCWSEQARRHKRAFN